MEQMLACCGMAGPDTPHRTVQLQPSVEESEASNFSDNAVYTYKYNIFTFVPRSLFEQFRRLANIYFLVISLLMVLGTYTNLFDSPLLPFSTLGPLVVVLLITMLKEGFEDLKRHRADHEVNIRQVKVLVFNGGGETEMRRWIDVRVGDMLVIEDRQEIAADVVVLATSDTSSVAYVETSNIDGETNLKSRKAAPTESGGAGSRFATLADVAGVRGVVECEHPNADIHHFLGNVRLDDQAGEQASVDAGNLLLRGSTLRNTHWACGVVVYTGDETKIVMNSSDPPSKLSNVEATVNTMVWIILFAQAVLSAISVVAFVIWKALYEDSAWYICEAGLEAPTALFREDCGDLDGSSDFGQYFTFIILYNNFIPISLYVTIEMVNYAQAFWLDQDADMYHDDTDTPALCRTSGACADLGMIEYIFSDKTGTLTRNVMEFQRCSIASHVYGPPPTNAETADLPEDVAAAKPKADWVPHDQLKARAGEDDHSAEYEFLLSMAVAHTVVLEKLEDGREVLQAESPDEEALVKGAGRLGLRFRGRRGSMVLVEVGGETREYEMLATIPFDSTRKRMSVVVRTPDGRYLVLCKGADSIILDPEGERPSRTKDFMGGHTERALKDHLNVFAADGLRTLVLARRELSNQEYQDWAQLWREAGVSVTDRAALREEAAKRIEGDLTVLGATAIEDKLQEGVPQCIADLADAGIKLWVLTGDKMETAINIGFSARLLTPKMSIVRIKYDEAGGTEATKVKVARLIEHFKQLTASPRGAWGSLRRGFRRGVAFLTGEERRSRVDSDHSLGAPPVPPEFEEEVPDLSEMATDYLAIVVDGPSLTTILQDHALQKGFLDLACLCNVVVACRVSPAQKADIVRLVQRGIRPKPITLAIGDGANDVGMIQAAQVGVGISGKEGMQAVNSSDFAIAQFRFLRNLTLVHGRWNYRRIAKTILYSFYKNIVLTFVLFFYQFACGFSGTSLFESYVYAGYNFFLGLPPLVLGLFDKDVAKETVLAFKHLYFVGRENVDLSPWATIKWICQAVWTALIIYLLTLGNYYYPQTIWNYDGEAEGIWVFGTTVYSALLTSMLLTAAGITYTWNRYIVGCFVFSVALYFFFLVTYTVWFDLSPDFFYVAFQMLSLLAFWLIVILVGVTTLMSELAVSLAYHLWKPTTLHHAVEFDRGYGDGGDFTDSERHARRTSADAHLMDEEGKMSLDHPDSFGSTTRPQSSRKFHLDPDSIRNLNSNLTPQQREDMGIHTDEDPHLTSSYNFDYVSDSYGVGAGSSTRVQPEQIAVVDVEDETMSVILQQPMSGEASLEEQEQMQRR